MIWFLLYILGAAMLKASMNYSGIQLGYGVKHTTEWIIAAVVIGLAAYAVVHLGDHPWWKLAPMLLGGAALFATVHRLLLNKWRGKHPCYTSVSNHYDTALWNLTFVVDNKAGRGPFQFRDNRAGRLAYITEAAVTAASVILIAVW